MEQQEFSYFAKMNAKWYNYFRKQIGSISLLGIYPEKWKCVYTQIHNSVDMNLRKLPGIVEDRGTWLATVHVGHKELDMT